MRWDVPDFLLVPASGVMTVVNVKPSHRLADPAVAEAPEWPGSLFTGQGWRWKVWSGCDPVLLHNVRFLAGYRRREIVPDAAVHHACAAVREGEQLAVAGLTTVLRVGLRLGHDGAAFTVVEIAGRRLLLRRIGDGEPRQADVGWLLAHSSTHVVGTDVGGEPAAGVVLASLGAPSRTANWPSMWRIFRSC